MTDSQQDLLPTLANQRRAVLLGASNLTNGLGNAVETSLRVWGAPLDLMAALGHGRSYGRSSRVLFRQLPCILDCGLWPALAAAPRVPMAALITDIGNDILYEEPVEQIAGWVEECLRRLRAYDAKISLTQLPLQNLPSLGRRRFAFFRRLFVPRCRLTLEQVIERCHELNTRLIEMAPRYDVVLVEQQRSWYGLDPMHYARLRRHRAWHTMISAWNPENLRAKFSATSFVRGAYWRSFGPEQRHLFGIEQRTRQPVHTLRDGTTISLF